MKTKLVLSIITLCISQISFGQSREKYSELIKEAWKLYTEQSYLESGKKYAEAFVANGHRGVVTDRYNAACSWALADKKDSSFVQLFKIAKNGNYHNLRHITTDKDLKRLHEDKRWEKVITIVKANKEEVEKDLDKPLVALLEKVYTEDQTYRKQIGEIEEKYGRNSEELKNHWALIHEKDSINLITVTKILDEKGWLSPNVIGAEGNSTLFLVIQHADLDTQIKYLPMMREAVKQGNARGSSLALLEDRVALRQGKKQIYGSQIGRNKETGEYYVSPLIDPENVDKRRAEVGLGTLAEYVSYWGMTWDVEKHKEQLKKEEGK